MRTQRAGIFTRRNTDVFGNFDELLVQYCANKRGYSNERVSIRLLCHLATIEGSRSGGRLVLALDFFSGHRTPDFFAHAWLLDIDLVFVPPRATSKLQVQDIGWNGGLKQNLTNITAATTHINTKNGPVHASTNFTINRLMSALTAISQMKGVAAWAVSLANGKKYHQEAEMRLKMPAFNSKDQAKQGESINTTKYPYSKAEMEVMMLAQERVLTYARREKLTVVAGKNTAKTHRN